MTLRANSSQLSAFAVFRRCDFSLLWLAQFISTMGSGLTAIAASILVYRITGAALSVGLMLMATALPSLFVGLAAGVFVDRWNRKLIMIITSLIQAALVAAIPIVLPLGIGWLYLLVAISILGMGLLASMLALAPSTAVAIAIEGAIGILNAPSYIGRSLLVQRHTPREMRGRVSSVFFVARDSAFLLGMAAAGLADLVDIRALLLVSAALLIGCGLLALALPGLSRPTAEWRLILMQIYCTIYAQKHRKLQTNQIVHRSVYSCRSRTEARTKARHTRWKEPR